mgnify:CR=1 FL=1
MCAFHQGQEANKSLHKKAEYKRAVDPSLFMTLQNRRGPYKGSPTAKHGRGISTQLTALDQPLTNTHQSPWGQASYIPGNAGNAGAIPVPPARLDIEDDPETLYVIEKHRDQESIDQIDKEGADQRDNDERQVRRTITLRYS